MINYLIEKYFALLGGVAYSNATSMSAFNYYEFEKAIPYYRLQGCGLGEADQMGFEHRLRH